MITLNTHKYLKTPGNGASTTGEHTGVLHPAEMILL